MDDGEFETRLVALNLGSVLGAIVDAIRDREMYTDESLLAATASADIDELWQFVGHAIDAVSDQLSNLGAVPYDEEGK
jgi:hypothetical protein